MSYSLGGARECHAPELSRELQLAKVEVGAGLGSAAPVQPRFPPAVTSLRFVNHTVVASLPELHLFVVDCVYRSALPVCASPSSPPTSLEPSRTASSLVVPWCRA